MPEVVFDELGLAQQQMLRAAVGLRKEDRPSVLKYMNAEFSTAWDITLFVTLLANAAKASESAPPGHDGTASIDKYSRGHSHDDDT